MDLGTYKIKCIVPEGYTLTGYGQYAFSFNQEIDLMDPGLPNTIRCLDWYTAHNMCTDAGCEIAQLIQNGDFVVTQKTEPDISDLIVTKTGQPG